MNKFGVFVFVCIGMNILLNAYSDSASCGQDASGNAVMIWQFFNESNNNFEIRTATFISQTQNWSDPVTISSSFHSGSNPMIVVSSGGNANAIWCGTDNNTGATSIQAAYLAFGGTWTSPTQITDSGEIFYNNFFETISSGNDNTCIVTWISKIDGLNAIRTSCGVAGAFTAPITISH